MSMVIKVSFETDEELRQIIERLEDLPLKVSGKEYETGRYRRIYLRTPDDRQKSPSA